MTDQQGLQVPAIFTQNQDPFETVEWVHRDARITSGDGTVIFEMKNIEVPVNWSQQAVDIVASKYFRKAGVPQADGSDGPETSVRQVVGRMADAWTHWGMMRGYFNSTESSQSFFNEIAYMLLHQMASPNSPQWFNTGLYESYGITGPAQGHYTTDPKTGETYPSIDAYSRPQVHACYIQDINDDLVNEGGIMDLWLRESRIFKYGSGTGTNFSSLRGKGEPLSGGGTSSGLISFLRVGDRAAGAIKSGGTTRRAAKMAVVDIDHPDVEEFIDWKVEEEKKAHALIAAGYPADFNGPAYDTISGQNANNSVRVTDAYMRALQEGADWKLSYRTNPAVGKSIPAKELWDKIANAAWQCADPGLQYDTTINDWHTVPNGGRINASNPCSEFMFLDNTACNLASLNLVKFENQDESFNFEHFKHAVRLWTIVLEISVLMAQYPSEKIARNSYDYRPLGLGYANLGALLMRKGMAYDSEEGRDYAAALTALMTAESYKASAEMAQALGPFTKFEENHDSMLRVIRNHARAAFAGSLQAEKHPPFGEYDGLSVKPYTQKHLAHVAWGHALDSWVEAEDWGSVYGYRNAQTTLLAPTGTIGLVMDCDTTGIEPGYSLVAYKKLAGGGMMKLVNQSVIPALDSLGYDADEQIAISNYVSDHGTVEGCPDLNPEHTPVFRTANETSAMGHLKMMATVQPFLSGAISKTINLPNTATVEDVENVYYEGWRLGLKAVALYRDGSKMSAPLSNKDHDKQSKYTEADLQAAVAEARNEARAEVLQEIPGLQRQERNKLSPKRSGITHEFTIGGQKVYLRTGEYPDGSLGEIFIDVHKEGAAFRSIMNCFAIMVSKGLQYGVPLEELVDTFAFTKFEPYGMVSGHPNLKMAGSIIDAVFRLLAYEYLGQKEMVQNPGQHVAEVLKEIEQYYDRLEPDDVLVHVEPDRKNFISNGTKTVRIPVLGTVTATVPRTSVSDAPFCSECGHLTTRNGTCYKCDNCGSTTGCS